MSRPIAPGARVGILGGGQLGRMISMAAARLGYACHVLAPEAESPAAHVAERFIHAAYDDRAALDELAASVQVVTIEFENVPVTALEYLAERVPTRPGAAVLRVTQDREREKGFLTTIGVPVAPYLCTDDPAEAGAWLEARGGAGILKTRRFGYDGKGQMRIDHPLTLQEAFATIGGDRPVLEGFIDFACELSVIAARGPDGAVACFPPVENRHRDHILKTTIGPADVSEELRRRALDLATRVAQGLDVAGLIAVEMFLTRDGELLVNELAPRPHNSGHWTIDACATSQFEQLVRAICGLPLGDPAPFAHAEMENLIGDEALAWHDLLAEPGARLHLYGKREIRPGRKMGHVTRLRALVDGGSPIRR
jgi:5-(carboxyamino)imidazole ribonucleotide synthase